VRHSSGFSPIQRLINEIRSARLESATYSRLHAMDVRIRASHRDRLKMFFWMWGFSGQPSIVRSPCAFAVASQILRRLASTAATHLHLGPRLLMRNITLLPMG